MMTEPSGAKTAGSKSRGAIEPSSSAARSQASVMDGGGETSKVPPVCRSNKGEGRRGPESGVGGNLQVCVHAQSSKTVAQCLHHMYRFDAGIAATVDSLCTISVALLLLFLHVPQFSMPMRHASLRRLIGGCDIAVKFASR